MAEIATLGLGCTQQVLEIDAMLMEAELREPLELDCGRPDRRGLHESVPVAASLDAAASPHAVPCAARPDFNDPLVRSLPIWSLAIALAIMENGAPSPA